MPSRIFRNRSHEPFAEDPHVQLKDEHTSGPLPFFNPTRARFSLQTPGVGLPDSLPAAESKPKPSRKLPPGLEFRWRARDNRKGRHTLIIDAEQAAKHGVAIPESTSGWRGTLKGLKRMVTEFPVWDVSYLVAQFFTWGSVIFVINGLFYWLPLVAPSTDFPGEGVAGGVTSFIGTIFYEIGVIFLMLEAFNENRTGCFGWALEEAFTHHDGGEGGKDSVVRLVPKKEACKHHHKNTRNIVGRPNTPRPDPAAESSSPDSSQPKELIPEQSWIWFPSWHELTNHYFREIGFMASLILSVSATVFWMVGFVSLPGVYDNTSTNALYGVFWTPDIVGSVGFVVSSAMLMIETQPNWYTPAPHLIGWHANFWNTVGSVGFLLSGVLGACNTATGSTKCLYQSDLSTTWGSFFFLVGSVILWYEALDKYPVEVVGKKS